MFFRAEVLQYPVVAQKNWALPSLRARVVEHNVPLAASGQKLLHVWQPVLVD
jgi:hypothetical protein